MDFVGRTREIAALRRLLRQGMNVLLTGRYGVGRSRLTREFAAHFSATWQFLFIDFSRPVSRSLNEALRQAGSSPGTRGRKSYTRLIDAKETLFADDGDARLPRVLVLDDIGKLTPRKLAFLEDLRQADSLLFIAVVENALPEADLFRLRALLYPSAVLPLGNLGHAETAEFFRLASRRYRLGWDEPTIQGLARAANGYPWWMVERLRREIEEGIPLSPHRPEVPGGASDPSAPR